MASLGTFNFGMLQKLHYNKLYFMRFIHVLFPYFAYTKMFLMVSCCYSDEQSIIINRIMVQIHMK